MEYRSHDRVPLALKTCALCAAGLLAASACSSAPANAFPPGGGGSSGSSSSNSGANGGGGSGVLIGGGTGNGGIGVIVTTGAAGGGTSGAGGDGGAPGDLPDPNCPAGVHTTVSGVVYDPAVQDPLYNITVFAPKSATLPPLPKGASCLSCDALFPPFYGSAVTDATGHFTVRNVPPGSNVPIVVQTGKWRKEFTIPSVTKCVDNPQPDKTLRLPKNAINGDGDLPDIAISTGNADSLECLLLRIGVDAGEWMGGAGTAGHIHIFHGNGANTMTPGPESSAGLWNTAANLMANDVTLLSCEGGETQDANGPLTAMDQQALLTYANAGGRVFASHFHYNWFNQGPWAALNLATWYRGQQGFNDPGPTPGDVYTTLLNGGVFPEGAALLQWLGVVNALTNNQLPIYYTRHNADVLPTAGPPNTPSQPWIVLDKTLTATAPKNVPVARGAQYFSVDTPVAMPTKCGRVVYSDLHVSGGAGSTEPGITYFTPDYPTVMQNAGGGVVPGECAMHPLTPQEKALEFMIFDLSSCLIPIGQVAMPPRGAPPR